MDPRGYVALAVLLLASAAPAPAQNPPTASPPAPKPPLLHTQIDLGYVSTAGNTSVRTLNLAEQLVVQPGGWVFTQTFAITNGSTAGVETANNLKAGLRADRTVGAGFRVYALGTFYRNRFAGIARQFEEAVGLAYGVLAGPTHVLDVEAGAGRNQLKGSDGTQKDYWTGRVAARYRFNFATSASTRASRPGFFASKAIGMPSSFNVAVVCGPILPARGGFAAGPSLSALAWSE